MNHTHTHTQRLASKPLYIHFTNSRREVLTIVSVLPESVYMPHEHPTLCSAELDSSFSLQLIQSYTVTDLKKETVVAYTHIHAVYCHKKDRTPSDFKFLVIKA